MGKTGKTNNLLLFQGITIPTKASVKNLLSADAKATVIASATKRNANQFACSSKNPKSPAVILSRPKRLFVKWRWTKALVMMAEMIC